MFSVSISSLPSRLLPCPWFSSFSSSSSSLTNSRLSTLSSRNSGSRVPSSAVLLFSPLPFCFGSRNRNLLTCRAAEYVFPDPIPEFAEAETERFRTHLLKTLSESDMYGESCEEIVAICTEMLAMEAECLYVVPFRSSIPSCIQSMGDQEPFLLFLS
ncbi:protein PLASTID REDOX INSENSITIVE 2, chloroplastic isoform X2 [Nymphaea colorata]|uniref:protein PLASTID REDOX INSENSITIVE 2, chloroplastic isoform X2 n=1 Tax=Nymphaea colorata TaxID=210225 RepID=UPI00129D6163|nr:protein PLASTID REDOX INSENSITIVE 2, chloroplastic isoform X2 [Nymphaea colorata]